MGKGGRKRKQGKREPNGQLSRKAEHMQERRAVDEEVAMSTGKKARERVHGVAAEHSGTELAGSVIGRLYLAAEWLEAAKQNKALADELRGAQIVERTEG